MPAGTGQESASERSGLEENVVQVWSCSHSAEDVVTQKIYQLRGVRSLLFSGEAPKPGFIVKPPDFSVLNINQDLTKP